MSCRINAYYDITRKRTVSYSWFCTAWYFDINWSITYDTRLAWNRSFKLPMLAEIPRERHGVSNQIQLDCLFNGLFRLTTRETIELLITVPRASYVESVSMLRRHHGSWHPINACIIYINITVNMVNDALAPGIGQAITKQDIDCKIIRFLFN